MPKELDLKLASPNFASYRRESIALPMYFLNRPLWYSRNTGAFHLFFAKGKASVGDVSIGGADDHIREWRSV